MLHLAVMKIITEKLQLFSSEKQVARINGIVSGRKVSGALISPLLTELRTRIREDLEDHVYLCVPRKSAGEVFR
jgi:hypothetical protein